MPTLEELEAQVRRRPLGRTLVEICLDLAVVPGFCTGAFWNELFDSIRLHGGSVATLMLEKVRREEAFCKEQDRTIGSNWDWQEMGREALRRVLGFCIGDVTDAAFHPVSELYAPAAAAAAGPSYLFATFSRGCTEADARGRTTAGPAVPIRGCPHRTPRRAVCDFHRRGKDGRKPARGGVMPTLPSLQCFAFRPRLHVPAWSGYARRSGSGRSWADFQA